MSATKEINPSVIAIVDFMKSNPNTAFTFAEMADGAGVARATGFIRGVKAILGGTGCPTHAQGVHGQGILTVTIQNRRKIVFHGMPPLI